MGRKIPRYEGIVATGGIDMANFLDSREDIEKLDTNKGLISIEQIRDQVEQVWNDTRSLEFPEQYKNVRSVVVAGMGGSAYGTHVIQTLYKDELSVPVFSIPDYTLPAWVNSETLVILSSYSGSTEETLSAGEDALKKGALITGLTSGGKLAAFLNEHKLPGYVFTPTYNPCNVPRYALGYSIFGQIALLSRIGLLDLQQGDYQEIVTLLQQLAEKYGVAVVQEKNPAKLLAFACVDRIPVVVAAEHLEGAAHVLANAFNETAKTYSEYRVIPELNHHLMEGLAFPPAAGEHLLFLLARSQLYGAGNQRRMDLTAEVIEKNHGERLPTPMEGKSKVAQAFELMVFGTYVAFYLAMLHNQNPTPNPWVDWFKAELKK